jgi:uncharacterized protein YbdZ (MbtH family)
MPDAASVEAPGPERKSWLQWVKELWVTLAPLSVFRETTRRK